MAKASILYLSTDRFAVIAQAGQLEARSRASLTSAHVVVGPLTCQECHEAMSTAVPQIPTIPVEGFIYESKKFPTKVKKRAKFNNYKLQVNHIRMNFRRMRHS